MSSVFKKKKKRVIEEPEVPLQVVDNSATVRALEVQRSERMGAVSQLLSHDNSYGGLETQIMKRRSGGDIWR